MILVTGKQVRAGERWCEDKRDEVELDWTQAGSGERGGRWRPLRVAARDPVMGASGRGESS